MSLGKALKSYVWWTYERGSVPYDVMVTLILAFIFLTPHFFDYGDRPKADWPRNEIRASLSPEGGLVYEVPMEMLPSRTTPPTDQDLKSAIAPVAGAVAVDRKEAVREVGGGVVAWRVWAHR